MRVLITLAYLGLGGTESYSVTVGEQLERLGHSVTICAPEASAEGRELVSTHGLRLQVGDPGDLDRVDAVLAQDAASAYLLADRGPEIRQVFAIHGFAVFEHPPVGMRPPPTAVVFNDRVGRRVAALASSPEVVRMRQPIDVERFRPSGSSRGRARRVLLLSNNLEGARLRLLEDVCADLGLELIKIGASGTPTASPEAAMADADIVVGYGRSVLEGMAMGCAAYVWDYGGGDGWVTPETYPAFEADGFSGAATDAIIDADRLRADFASYRPELASLGYDLVRKHHSATEHAEALLELLDGATAPVSGDILETVGLLVRAEFRAANRVRGLGLENQQLRKEREILSSRAETVEATLDALLRSRSWRLLSPLRRAASRLRRR